MHLFRIKLPLLLVCVVVLSLVQVGQANAALVHQYAGNFRNPAYGVKANIATPARKPVVAHGVVFNFVSNIDTTQANYARWVQTGWVQGDGFIGSPDGVQTYPTDPWSYEEKNTGPYWTSYLFAKLGTSSQPLNWVRAYEVVANTTNNPSYWTVYVAGAAREMFYPYATPTEVEAQSELVKVDNWPWPEDWAGFTGIKYKGQFVYYPFDQDHLIANNPPWRTGAALDHYDCSNPQNY
ncbi:MAG: hypothetical protein M1274_06930 [Actinobacteria bacterium]|nr:hypothetical protein [Actinomycetota bacterium]